MINIIEDEKTELQISGLILVLQAEMVDHQLTPLPSISKPVRLSWESLALSNPMGQRSFYSRC